MTRVQDALRKEVQVFERSIPVVLIALAFVGAGTAAVVQVFGIVEGSATVEQAVVIENSPASNHRPAATYSVNAAGGDVEQGTFSVTNNADDPVSVDVSTSVTAGPSGGFGGLGAGLTNTVIVSDQWTLSDGDSTPGTASVAVAATEENVVTGDYALHFTSTEATSDYVRAFFPVSSLNGTEVFSYTGVANAENPLADEIWLIESDGDQVWTHGASSTSGSGDLTTVSFDLDAKTWTHLNGTVVTPDWSDVTAVAIGQGAPSDPASNVTVDTYADNVVLDSGSPIDEQDDPTILLLPTGTSPHPVSGSLTTEYQTNVVTAFATSVWPGNYTLETTVSPS